MSVFRASNSSTAWPTAADPFADGPTERLASADSDGPSDPPPRRGIAFAVLLAMVALLVAAGAGMLAWRALGRAEQAYARTLPPVAATASARPVPSYAGVVLRIQAGCDVVTDVDLDEPRVNAPAAGADLRYDGRCGEEEPRVELGASAVAGSQAADEDVGEDDCAEAIRTRPLGGGVSVPVEEDAIFCILTGPGGAASTSGTGADRAGVRLVRVEVIDVTKDGTAELRATSWAVR